MDISFVLRKFRKSISGFTILALLTTFVSFVGVAQASSFPDTDGHWGEAYIEALYDAGVVSGNDDGTFNPDGTLNRAELSKMLVLAYTEGLDSDAAAVYSDVSETDWFYPYANDAYQKGIMTGEGDGSFNGAGMVNRATLMQAIYNAAGLTPTGEALPFNDVMSSDWFYDAVDAGYWWSIVDGESANTYNPAGYATRAAAAKVVYNGWYPVERDGEDPVDPTEECDAGYELDEYGDCVEVTEPSSEGTLMMSLSADTPDSATIPALATSVELVAYDLTAEDDDVNFDGVTVNQYGVSSMYSNHSVYAYAEIDGVNTRLSSGQSINSSTHDVTFNNLDLEVEEGETVRFSIRMDVGGNATSSSNSTKEVGLQIESADMVDVDGADVSGSFPLKGELFSIATDVAGTITIEKNGTVDNPQVGEDGAEVAKFKLSASNEAADLEEIGLYLSGTVNTSDVTSFDLWVSGEDEAIASAEMVDSLDVIRFMVDDYQLEKGGTKSFTVTANFDTGRTGDTVLIYVDEDTDILATGDLYGYGMSVTRSDYDGASCTSALSYADCSSSTLEGGDVTISSNGPAATDVAINGNDVTLMNFNLTTVTDVTFKNFPISLTVSENAGNDAAGLITAAGVANVTDIRIVDTESGEEVFSSVDSDVMTSDRYSTPIIAGTDQAQAFHLYTDDLSLSAGEELSLAIMVDIENNTALSGETIVATLDLGTSYPEMRDINNKVLTNSSVLVPASAVTGKTHTLQSPSLTVSAASTPVSETYVKGSQDVEFVGFVFACGDSSSCRVTDLTVAGYLDDDADGSFETSSTSTVDGTDNETSLNAYVGSIWLVDGEGNTVSGPESVNGTTFASSFNDIDWTLDAGATEILYVVGDLSNDSFATATGEKIAFGLTGSSQITAEDDDGNSITASGSANTGQTVAMSTSGGGVLTVSVDSSTPKEDILLTGAMGQEVATYRFSGTDENFVIDKLSVTNRDTTVPGDWDNNVDRVGITYMDSEGAEQTEYAFLVDGSADFTGLDIFVERDDNTTVTLLADINEADSGATPGTEFVDFGIGFDTFEATSSASGETYNATKMEDTDADGSIADSSLVLRSSGSTAFDDTDFVNTVTYTNDAADLVGATTLGGSASFSIDNNGADQTDLPVGTLLCMTDAGGDTACNALTDDIYVVTAWADGATEDTVTATLINDGGDGTYEAADEVLYAISGEDYLTDSNQMWLYSAQPVFALDSSSPTTGTFAAASTIMKFSVSNSSSAEDSVLVRQESNALRVNADSTTGWAVDATGNGFVLGTSSTVRAEGSASVTLTEDGVSAVTDYGYYDHGAAAGLNNYGKVQFWIRVSGNGKAAGDLQFVMDNATDMTAAADEVLNIGALTTDTWSLQTLSCSGDVCGDASTQYTGINNEANPDNDNIIYIDGLRFYAASDANDSITFNLSSDASMATTASDIRALLKEDGATVAEGGINFSSTSAATIQFFPYGSSYTDLEIEEGGSKTFSLVVEADEIITDQSGTDDRLTPYIVLGTASGGSVTTPGGFVWASDNGAGSYVQATWVGQVSDTNFSGNTLEY